MAPTGGRYRMHRAVKRFRKDFGIIVSMV